MNRTLTRILAAVMVMLTVLTVSLVGVSAVITGDEFAVNIKGETNRVNVKGTIPLTAEIIVPADSEATDADFTVAWSVDKPHLAEINDSGVFTAIDSGEVTVTATVTDKEGTSVSDDYTVFVTRAKNPALNLLSKRQVLGYRYNYDGDYFYTDNDKCWQRRFGFLNAFDLVCPYILLEYDYIRMHFNYGGKAWMIQLWKGQYGMVFFGSEIGVYYKNEELPADFKITPWTHYKCAVEPENRLGMEMSLYWDKNRDGNYIHQFTRPYDDYWWCTGFEPGHLWETEPASELRMVSTIDLKDPGMADVFTKQLEICGFKRSEAESRDTLENDAFRQDGTKVDLVWQDISEAESSTVVKATFGTLVATGSISMIFLVLGFMFLSMLSTVLFIFII